MNTINRSDIHKALRALYLPQLGRSPLAELKIVQKQHASKRRDETPSAYALSLREILRAALKELRPMGEMDINSKHWRPYYILQQEFIDGVSPEEIAEKLSIAPRTYQAERAKGLDLLGNVLLSWEDEESLGKGDKERSKIFLTPSKPSYPLVGRFPLLEEIKQQLTTYETPTTIALTGMPGVGKTAIATELAYQPEIGNRFDDGVLWAGLGRFPNLLAVLGNWGLELGVSSSEIAKKVTLEERANLVRASIGTRRILIVIDDAWTLEDALAFRVGGPLCSYLLTTRDRNIARDFAEEGALEVKELSASAALVLLTRLMPEVMERESELARELIELVGGLPLSLILMARFIRAIANTDNEVFPLRKAVPHLRNVEKRLALAMPQAPTASHPSMLASVPISLIASIEISDEALNSATRQAIRSLALLPPKPNTFSMEAGLAISNTTTKTLSALVEAGLLEESGSGRYTIHQTIFDYLTFKHTPEETSIERVINYFMEYLARYENEYDLLSIEGENLHVSLNLARDKQPASFVKGVTLLFGYMEARGLYKLAKDYLNQAQLFARNLNDEGSLLILLHQLGKVSEKLGDYILAKQSLEEGLLLAQGLSNDDQTTLILARLGSIYRKLGIYEGARTYFQQGLALATNTGSLSQVDILRNLSTLAASQGNYKESDEHLQTARAIAERAGNLESISSVLQNLGGNASYQGRYDEAITYLQQGLDIARSIKHPERIGSILQNLGGVEINRGNYDEANAYLQEALIIARELGHIELISFLLQNLGSLEIYRGNYREARAYQKDALALTRNLGLLDLQSAVLQGLGEIETFFGEFEQAEGYFQQSLSIAEELHHSWLISGTLVEWGELLYVQDRWLEAKEKLNSALEVAEGIQEFVARAHFYLAKSELALGSVGEAREHLQKSLALFEAIHHQDLVEVKKWQEVHL